MRNKGGKRKRTKKEETKKKQNAHASNDPLSIAGRSIDRSTSSPIAPLPERHEKHV